MGRSGAVPYFLCLALYKPSNLDRPATLVPIIFRCLPQLYKNVAERGRWSELFMEAHADFKAYRYSAALTKYYLLSELGYETAQSNVAFLLDKGEHWAGIVRRGVVWGKLVSLRCCAPVTVW